MLSVKPALWPGLKGYDLILQAFSGLMDLNGPSDDDHPWRFVSPIVDEVMALVGYTGILEALFKRERSNEVFPQQLDIALINSMAIILANVIGASATFDQEATRQGDVYASIHPYQLYQAKDELFVLAIGSEANWNNFCQAIEREDLVIDPLFKTNDDRVNNRQALDEILVKIFQTRPVAEWIELFREKNVPASDIKTVYQFLHNPQTINRQLVTTLSKEGKSPIMIASSSLIASGLPRLRADYPHSLGEDTDRILRELGYSQEDIAQFREQKTVF